MMLEFQRLADSIQSMANGAPVYFVENQGNWGDALIKLGTYAFFRHFDIDYESLSFKSTLKEKVNSPTSITIYGRAYRWKIAAINDSEARHFSAR